MAIALRILYLLLFVRLMAPPGVCLCKLSAPAVAYLSGMPLPADQQAPDEDHTPGCPCSPLSAGMGLRAPTDTVPVPDLSLDLAASLIPSAAARELEPSPVGLIASVDVREVSCRLLI